MPPIQEPQQQTQKRQVVYHSPKTGKDWTFDWDKPTDPTPDDYDGLKKWVENQESTPSDNTNNENTTSTAKEKVNPGGAMSGINTHMPDPESWQREHPLQSFALKSLETGKKFVSGLGDLASEVVDSLTNTPESGRPTMSERAAKGESPITNLVAGTASAGNKILKSPFAGPLGMLYGKVAGEKNPNQSGLEGAAELAMIDPEEVKKDYKAGNYGSLAADVAAPLALGYGFSKLMGGKAEAEPKIEPPTNPKLLTGHVPPDYIDAEFTANDAGPQLQLPGRPNRLALPAVGETSSGVNRFTAGSRGIADVENPATVDIGDDAVANQLALIRGSSTDLVQAPSIPNSLVPQSVTNARIAASASTGMELGGRNNPLRRFPPGIQYLGETPDAAKTRLVEEEPTKDQPILTQPRESQPYEIPGHIAAEHDLGQTVGLPGVDENGLLPTAVKPTKGLPDLDLPEEVGNVDIVGKANKGQSLADALKEGKANSEHPDIEGLPNPGQRPVSTDVVGKGPQGKSLRETLKDSQVKVDNNPNPQIRNNPAIKAAIPKIVDRVRQSHWYKSLYEPVAVSMKTRLERLGDGGKYLSKTISDLLTDARRVAEPNKLIKDTLGDMNDPDSRISKLIEKADDPKEARKIVNKILGNYKHSAPNFSKTAKVITKAEVVTHLSQFVFNNLSDLAAGSTRFGGMRMLRAARQLFTEGGKAFTIAEKSGALEPLRAEAIDGVSKGDLLGKAYGMYPMEKVNRTIHSIAGRAFLKDMFDKLKKNPNDKGALANIKPFIKEDIGDLLKQKELTEEQLNFAGGRASELTSGNPDEMSLPDVFNGNPILKLALLFKRFSFINTKNLLDYVKTQPTKKSAAGAALKALGFYTISGEIAGDLKAAVDGLVSSAYTGNSDDVKDEIINRKSPLTTGNYMVDRLMADAMQSWFLGLVGDVGESLSHGKDGIYGLIAGPVGNDAGDLANAGISAYGGHYFQAGKFLARRIPFIGPGIAKGMDRENNKKKSSFMGSSKF